MGVRRRETKLRRSFHDQQQRNAYRLRAILLVYFLLAVIVGRAAGVAMLHVADPDAYYTIRYGIDMGYGPDSAPGSGYVLAVGLALLLLAWVEYRRIRRRGDELVLSLVEARPLREEQLENTGEEMAIAAGIEPPRMWVVETEELNAFACERPGGSASVALTRGLLERLTRDEIQAVVAHEVAHIRNGDARLMTMLIGLRRSFHLISLLALGPLRLLIDAVTDPDAIEVDDEEAPGPGTATNKGRSFWDEDWGVRRTLLAVLATPFIALAVIVVSLTVSLTLVLLFGLMITFFPWVVGAYAALQLAREHSPGFDAWISRLAERSPWLWLFLLVPGGLMIGPAILVLGILAPLAFGAMRLVVSRNREFQADVTAVELTRNPDALRSALEKIRDADAPAATSLPRVLTPLAIAPPRRRVMAVAARLREFLDTHPSLDARIERLIQMGARETRTRFAWPTARAGRH